MPVPHHLVFTGQMPFLPPNQERQSTEGFSSVSRVNTVRVSNRIKVRFIFSSDGSVSAFEVGIGFFPIFFGIFNVISVFGIGISKYCDIGIPYFSMHALL